MGASDGVGVVVGSSVALARPPLKVLVRERSRARSGPSGALPLLPARRLSGGRSRERDAFATAVGVWPGDPGRDIEVEGAVGRSCRINRRVARSAKVELPPAKQANSTTLLRTPPESRPVKRVSRSVLVCRGERPVWRSVKALHSAVTPFIKLAASRAVSRGLEAARSTNARLQVAPTSAPSPVGGARG